MYKEVVWLAINSKPNATVNLFNAVTNSKKSRFNTTAQFEIIQESSRNLVSSNNLIFPLGDSVEVVFKKIYGSQYLPSFARNISTSHLNIAKLAMSGEIDWYQNNYRPF